MDCSGHVKRVIFQDQLFLNSFFIGNNTASVKPAVVVGLIEVPKESATVLLTQENHILLLRLLCLLLLSSSSLKHKCIEVSDTYGHS